MHVGVDLAKLCGLGPCEHPGPEDKLGWQSAVGEQEGVCREAMRWWEDGCDVAESRGEAGATEFIYTRMFCLPGSGLGG